MGNLTLFRPKSRIAEVYLTDKEVKIVLVTDAFIRMWRHAP
jgi:hypothetical protein